MATLEWWMLALAGLGGAIAGGLLTWVTIRARVAARLRNAAEELQRHAASAQKARTALVGVQADLDSARSAMARQATDRVAEPTAALARTERRLQAAYEELDILRRRPAQDSSAAELTDGFAATRPMYDAM